MTKTGKPIPERLFNARKNGFVTGADSIFDDDLQMTQAEINAIVMAGSITYSLSATPSPVFVGVQSVISLTASTSRAVSSITIKKGVSTIATGSGTSLSGSDTITPTSAGNIAYTAYFVTGASSKPETKDVVAVYPIRTGSGAAYIDGTPLNTPKTSPAGTYNITVSANGSYVWINVPSTMTIHGAQMGGFEFPLESPDSVTIDGIAYKSYRSSNTYDAGILTVILN